MSLKGILRAGLRNFENLIENKHMNDTNHHQTSTPDADICGELRTMSGQGINQSERATPRTDIFRRDYDDSPQHRDACAEMEKLERELAEAREQRDRLEEALKSRDADRVYLDQKWNDMRDQRQALAEAGQEVIDAGGNFADLLAAQRRMKATLASLDNQE